MKLIFMSLLVVMLVALDTSWADEPPEFFLKVKYSLEHDKTEQTGIIYDYWIEPDDIEKYFLNVPNKLLSEFRRYFESDRTITVHEEILLYKFPLSADFGGMSSFSGVGKKEIKLRNIKTIEVIGYYAVDYGGALHSRLTKEDLESWASGNGIKLVAETESEMCYYEIYQYGNGHEGIHVVERIKELAPKTVFRGDWRSKPENSEYVHLIDSLRTYHMVMLEYCGC